MKTTNKFFNRLFKGNPGNNLEIHSNDTNMNSDVLSDINIPEDLFIDNKPPNTEDTVQVSNSELNFFLEKDYHSLGFSEGYQFHSIDIIHQSQNAISSEFRQILEKEMIYEKNEISKLQILKIEIGDQFPAQAKTLEVKINERKDNVEQYKKQMELSVESEGWISPAIHHYKKGFEHGLSAYISENEFLKSSKII